MDKKLVEQFDNFVQAAGLYRLKSVNAAGTCGLYLEEVYNENAKELGDAK